MLEQINLRRCQVIDNRKIYFFPQAYEQCGQKALQPFVWNILTELEAERGISFSEDLRREIEEKISQCSDVPLHPVIPILLGEKKPINTKAILDFHEHEVFILPRDTAERNQRENEFVDLCMVLGDNGRAARAAKNYDRRFDLLEYAEQGAGVVQDELMIKARSDFWINRPGNTDIEAADFTSLMMRIAEESAIGRGLAAVLTEFYGKGYQWDALCLSCLLMPGNPMIGHFKRGMDKLVPQTPVAATWIRAAKQVLKLKDKGADGDFDCAGLDPLTAYRMFKIDIYDLHSSAKLDDFRLTTAVEQKRLILQRIIFECLLTRSPHLAEYIADDAHDYVKSIASQHESAYFPGVMRLAYASITRMLVRLVTSIKLENSTASTRSLELFLQTPMERGTDFKAMDLGLMNFVTSHWISSEIGMRIWREEKGTLPVVSFCEGLIKIGRNVNPSDDSKRVLLALHVMVALASKDFTPDSLSREVERICASELRFEKQVQRAYTDLFTKNFNPNPAHWTVICMDPDSDWYGKPLADIPTEAATEEDDAPPSPVEPQQTHFGSGMQFLHHATQHDISSGMETAVESPSSEAEVESDEPCEEVPKNEEVSDEVAPAPTECELSMESTKSLSTATVIQPKEEVEEFEQKDPDWSTVPQQQPIPANSTDVTQNSSVDEEMNETAPVVVAVSSTNMLDTLVAQEMQTLSEDALPVQSEPTEETPKEETSQCSGQGNTVVIQEAPKQTPAFSIGGFEEAAMPPSHAVNRSQSSQFGDQPSSAMDNYQQQGYGGRPGQYSAEQQNAFGSGTRQDFGQYNRGGYGNGGRRLQRENGNRGYGGHRGCGYAPRHGGGNGNWNEQNSFGAGDRSSH